MTPARIAGAVSLGALLPLFLAAQGADGIATQVATAAALGLVLVSLVRGSRPLLRRLDAAATLLVGLWLLATSFVGRPVTGHVVWALALVALGGGIAAALAGQGEARPEDEGTWSRALAFVVVLEGILLVLSIWAFGPALESIAYAWLAASCSFLPATLLSVACLARRRMGFVLTSLALLTLEATLVWYIASLDVFLEQARPLAWDEVKARLADPGTWAILREGLLSFHGLLLTLSIFGGFGLLARSLRLLPSLACRSAWVRVVAGLLVTGYLLVARQDILEPERAKAILAGSLAPWYELHPRSGSRQPLQWRVAEAMRAKAAAPFWAEGPAPLLAGLAGIYRGRSIVIVAMESQRASDVAGLGDGAFAHLPLSPELSRLMGEGLSFTNDYAASASTNSLLWGLFTSLPEPPGSIPAVERSPEAARLGRLPAFGALGYRLDWLCPAPPRWDNWDKLLGAVGARWWINENETSGLPRTYWTAWGMPDEQLYGVALSRYRQALGEHRPILLGILTVSNHHPFTFPDQFDGQAPSHDHIGGMKYADRSVGRFIESLKALPAEDRPIVYITADTSHPERIRGNEPMGPFCLEGIRIPGLLLLPDGRLAGQRYSGPFCHEDVLDLLYMLVSGADAPTTKFRARHRVAFCAFYGDICLTETSYLHGPDRRFFRIDDRWHLTETPHPPDADLLDAAWRQRATDLAALWPAG